VSLLSRLAAVRAPQARSFSWSLVADCSTVVPSAWLAFGSIA
jgi:hypothetical protein